MTHTVTYANVRANQIEYDRETGLFPFSPRNAIDPLLVARLQDSIAEVGLIQPVVLRSSTNEGIAGNHRLLAYMQWAKEQGQEEGEIFVPAILVDCDEATAITIALVENEIREDLTEWETIRALLQVTKRKPRIAERVFKIDQETATQLEFWPENYESLSSEHKDDPKPKSRLTREWPALINNRLSLHPELRQIFINQLRKPSWVNSRTIALLEQEITAALLQQGVMFESGRTWNSQPTDKCLCSQMSFEELLEQLRSGSDMLSLQPDGSIPGCCPYLRLVPQYIQQISSDLLLEGGAEFVNNWSQRNRQILDQVEAYCIAPNARTESGCFHHQEMDKIHRLVRELEDEGFSAMSPQQLAARKAAGDFTWINPAHEGQPCTPGTCRYARESSSGYRLVVQPGSAPRMVCVHAECGKAAQATLVDLEAHQRKVERRRHQEALEQLCRATVSKTLFRETNRNDPILTPDIFEEIERLLVPAWDTLTMERVITGWQQETKIRIAAELGSGGPESTSVTTEFRRRYGDLASKPNKTTIPGISHKLRELILSQCDGLERWVACLALARSWRDSVNSIQDIERHPLLACEDENREVAYDKS